MSVRYLRSVQGILKLFQIIFGIIIIILFCLSRFQRMWNQNFLFYLAIITAIITILLLFVSLCEIYNSIIWPWKSIEIGYHITAAILFGIGASLVMVYSRSPTPWVIAGVFGYLNTALYGLHTYFSAD
ncbi:unnamed protein product [Gordionus sp. m RMFG-2023]